MSGGYPILLRVIFISSVNDAIRVTINGVTETVHLAHGTYFLRGNGAADDLVAAFLDALNSHSEGGDVAAELLFQRAPDEPAIHFRFFSGSDLGCLFADAATSFSAALLGFPQTDQGIAVLEHLSTLSSSACWVGNDVVRSLEPASSSERSTTRAASGKARSVQRRDEIRDRIWVQEYIEERRMNQEAISADEDRAFSTFKERLAGGSRFEMHEASTFFSNDRGGEFDFDEDLTLVGTFTLSDDFYPRDGLFASRLDGGPLYSFTGQILTYVA